MKKRQKNSLRQKTRSELEKMLVEQEKKLTQLKIETGVSRPKDVFSQGRFRQEIAVIKTVIREKEFEEVAK